MLAPFLKPEPDGASVCLDLEFPVKVCGNVEFYDFTAFYRLVSYYLRKHRFDLNCRFLASEGEENRQSAEQERFECFHNTIFYNFL